MKKKLLLISFLLVFFISSSRAVTFDKSKIETPTLTKTFAVANAPTLTRTHTAAPKISPVHSTLPPSPIPTATWVYQGSDKVVVPILLYHHIGYSPTRSLYYVSPDQFEKQLKLLRDWEYTSIATELLVKAIKEGALLPPRPILITFDDGNLDNYTAAFPLMQKYGFTGTLYVGGYSLGAPGFLSVDQIQEMAGSGWEIGSHGMRHPDLSMSRTQELDYEIAESKYFLEKTLELPIRSFAYPFGYGDEGAYHRVYTAGYIAGLVVGSTSIQNSNHLFTLNRFDIKGTYNYQQFASLLPWSGDLELIPKDDLQSPDLTATSLP